jgi:hypothetical protein
MSPLAELSRQPVAAAGGCAEAVPAGATVSTVAVNASDASTAIRRVAMPDTPCTRTNRREMLR